MTLGDSLDPDGGGEYLEGPRRRRDRYRFRDGTRSRDGNGTGNRMREHARNPIGRLIAGVFIAGWGLSLLLDNLGLGDMGQYTHRVWPAVLVIVGVTLLIHRDSNPERYGFWGTVCMIAGTWMYLSQRDWFHLGSVIWPTLLVVLGAAFVYRGVQRSSHVP